MKINPNTLSRSRRIDSDASASFERLCERLGYDVRPASRHEDMFDHVDYHISKGGETLKIELKGCKRGVDEGRFLVEIANVNGDAGWLFGKADRVVFHLGGQEFASVPLRKLRESVGFYRLTAENMVSRPDQADLPMWYRRADRPKEIVTYVSSKFLLACGAVVVA